MSERRMYGAARLPPDRSSLPPSLPASLPASSLPAAPVLVGLNADDNAPPHTMNTIYFMNILLVYLLRTILNIN